MADSTGAFAPPEPVIHVHWRGFYSDGFDESSFMPCPDWTARNP